jgi:hypothetical protein
MDTANPVESLWLLGAAGRDSFYRCVFDLSDAAVRLVVRVERFT